MVPVPQDDRRQRRQFTPEKKARILAEADACTERGQLGQLLRREGIYSSHLTSWRALGERRGSHAVFEMLGAMMQSTAGTLAIDKVHSIMGNGELVAASLHCGITSSLLVASPPLLIVSLSISGSGPHLHHTASLAHGPGSFTCQLVVRLNHAKLS